MRSPLMPPMLGLLLAGCLQLLDPAGRRCNDELGCALPRGCVGGFCVAGDGGADAGPNSLEETFEELPVSDWAERSFHGRWEVISAGGGSVRVIEDGSHALELAPAAVAYPASSLALVSSEVSMGDLDLTVRLHLPQTGASPRMISSIIWHRSEAARGYALGLSFNSWELGRRDPAQANGLELLASGALAHSPFAGWVLIHVQQRGATLSVFIDGAQVYKQADSSLQPYLFGGFAFSSENVLGHFDDLVAHPIP